SRSYSWRVISVHMSTCCDSMTAIRTGRRTEPFRRFAKQSRRVFTRLFAVGPADPPIHAPAAADRAVFAEEILKGRPQIWRERPVGELHSPSFQLFRLGFASRAAAGIVAVIDREPPCVS